MRCLILNFAVALVTFVIGIFVWSANTIRLLRSEPAEPLRVSISKMKQAANSSVLFDHYTITVENVSRKTVRGYSLGLTFRCTHP